MQSLTASPRLYELEKQYPFLELHEGAFPYNTKVLSQESVLEGSSVLAFQRILQWLGEENFTADETHTLWQEFWLSRPEFLLEALSHCQTSKGVVVDDASGPYFYLLTTDGVQLRQELVGELKALAGRFWVTATA